MIKRLLLLLGLGLTTTIIFGQTALAGKVTEEGTSTPAEFATVRIFKDGVLVTGAQSDDNGAYNISNIDPGTYTVEVTYVGFNPQRVEGVVVKAGKVNTLNVQLTKGVTLTEFEVKDYAVPLIEQDNTTQGGVYTSENIKNLPNKNINAIVGSTAGVSTGGEGGNVSIRGSRTSGTIYYLDGIPISGAFIPTWDIEQLQVITGGLGAEYGDVTGGIISGTTKGPSNSFGGGVEVETSELFDEYGYNLINANFSGPIIKRKETNESILGYRLSGSYTGYIDNDPSAVDIYIATDEAKAKFAADPLTQTGPSSTDVHPTAEFLKNGTGEVYKSKIRPDQKSRDYDFTGRLDYRITRDIDVSLSGSYNDSYQKFSPGNTWWLLNSQNNPENLTSLYRLNFRMRHRLGKAFVDTETPEESKASLSSFRNASYTLQFFYQNAHGKSYDSRHKENLFDYGHVGEFNYNWQPIALLDIDGIPYHVDNLERFTGVDFTNSKNPGLAAYNKLIVDTDTDEDYPQRNGVSNSSYTSVWDYHTNINSIYNSFNKNQAERRTFQGSMGFDFLPGGSESGRHNIQFGVFYEERISRNYTINPYGLWTLARGLQNIHILGIDTLKNTGIKVQALYTDPTGEQFLVEVDSFGNRINPLEEGRFYKEIRKALGLPIEAYVEIDELDPSFLRLDMFSARELTDEGIAGYYGYDYLGNKISDQTQFNDFWTHRDANNERDYPVAPYHPIYGAAYIQDKFTFKDVIFRLGIRADYFDNNTKVLKDKFSYKEIYTAKEFFDKNPQLVRPPAVEDDFKVYLNSGTSIKAYRKDEQWYFNNGNKANDGNVIFGGQVINPAYKNDIDINEEGFDPNSSFQDYKGQLNIMPRLAFSFPISDEANFFAHYDILVQRPTSSNFVSPLQYYYYTSNTPTANPDLKPERTIDYEVGFQQKISNSSALKISAYYKEMRDMIQSRTLLFLPEISSLETYDNIDFGTVKGFSVTYDLRRTGNVQVSANYTLQFADGTGSDANSQRGISGRGNIRTLFPLNFDERHVFNINFDYRFESGKKYNGPRPGGLRIFENTGLNIDARAISGRPYTKSLQALPRGGQGYQGAINGARLPWKFFLNLKIDKDFALNKSESSKRKYYLNVYFRAENVLDLKTIVNVYSASGDPDDPGYLLSPQGIASIKNTQASGRDVQAFTDSYQWYVLNPDNYAAPRRLYIGASFQF